MVADMRRRMSKNPCAYGWTHKYAHTYQNSHDMTHRTRLKKGNWRYTSTIQPCTSCIQVTRRSIYTRVWHIRERYTQQQHITHHRTWQCVQIADHMIYHTQTRLYAKHNAQHKSWQASQCKHQKHVRACFVCVRVCVCSVVSAYRHYTSVAVCFQNAYLLNHIHYVASRWAYWWMLS